MASSNTSKTAHVMNLLSKNRGGTSDETTVPQAEIQPESQGESTPAAAAPAPAAPVAPIISSINADAAVSSQIREALEAELKETPKTAPAPKPSVQQAAPLQQSASVPQAASVQAPVQHENPIQQTISPPQETLSVQEEPLEAASLPQEPVPEEEKPAYINVMQILVEEKADEYMKMFGICCCDKCRVDVRAVVIGRSNTVGKPMAMLLLNENCTVTVCHSKTDNIAFYTKNADIVVVAVGRPEFLKKDMVKEGAVVIDVGINRVDGKLIGDVDFDAVSEVAGYITPVPGGVGPMTISMLLYNTLMAAKKING